MKITVITGSPHKKGTSFLLADEFIRGAKEAGHDVFRFDAAFSKVAPCNGCDHCGMGSRDCVYKDDMLSLNPHLLEAELVVLLSPLYYFGFSAQLKTVIDRFYAITNRLHGKKKGMLMVTAWNSDEWTMKDIAAHYRTLMHYMDWQDIGMLLAKGCGTRSMIEATGYPEQAYQMGKTL